MQELRLYHPYLIHTAAINTDYKFSFKYKAHVPCPSLRLLTHAVKHERSASSQMCQRGSKLMQQIQGGSEEGNVRVSRIRAMFKCTVFQKRLLQIEIFCRIRLILYVKNIGSLCS